MSENDRQVKALEGDGGGEGGGAPSSARANESNGKRSAGGREGGGGWILVLLAAALLVQLGWRVWLGAGALWLESVPERSVTLEQWRMGDQFVGLWGLIILLLADRWRRGAAERREGRIWAAAVGWMLALAAAGIAVGLIGGGAGRLPVVDMVVAGLLAAAAAVIGVRQLLELAREFGPGGGLTVEQLWRLVAVQWMLAWVSAEVFLRYRFRDQGGVEDSGQRLLFALPAFGMMPNVMMAVGIAWWRAAAVRIQARDKTERSAWQGAGHVRARAWAVALLAVNLGAICLVMGEIAGRWWGVAGVVPMVFGVLMYGAGFGRTVSRRGLAGGGWMIAAGFAVLLLAVILQGGERLRSGLVLREYSEAWRFWAGPGAWLMWLLGMGALGMRAFVADRVQPRQAAMIACALTLTGVLATGGVLALAGIWDQQWMQAVGFGCVLMAIGMAVAAAAALRAWRGRR